MNEAGFAPDATLKIVGIGGGTGLPVLLKGLRTAAWSHRSHMPFNLSIAAVVTVADNGGSSGLLRQYLNIPAVGDLRNCLAALSDADPLLLELFQHRFLAC